MTREPTFTSGQTLLNRFKVLKTIFGGMGEIIICHDTHQSEKSLVVLKTYFDEILSDSIAKQRFIKEAEAWLKLGYAPDSFYIGIREIINLNHKPYILMDYCKGGDLRSQLKNGALAIDTALIIATQMIIALWDIDDVHKMIHRDLKPENILFDQNNAVKVTDLGIVKFIEESASTLKPVVSLKLKTQVGEFLGTVLYAAPEQILGLGNLDARVDIWAFGAIVYEMIVGQPPFIAKNIDQLLEAILSAPPLDVEQFRKKVNPKLYDIVTKCLQKDKAKRYKSFQHLAVDWEYLVKFTNSPSKLWLDRRQFIDDKRMMISWMYLFPDRKITSEFVSIKLNHLAHLKEANGLYNLSEYEKVVSLCDTILGDISDPVSILSLFLTGQISDELGFSDKLETEGGKREYHVNFPKAAAIEALSLKMKALVSIIEEKPSLSNSGYIQEFLTLSSQILDARIKDKVLLYFSAQGFQKAKQHQKAEQVLHALLKDDEHDVSIAAALFVSICNQGDNKAIEDFSDWIFCKHGETNNLASLFLCARAAGITKKYDLAIGYALDGLELDPSNLGLLEIACVSLINQNEIQDAAIIYGEMERYNPESPLTHKMRKIFNNLQT